MTKGNNHINYSLYNELLHNILDEIYDTDDLEAWHHFLNLQNVKANEGYVTARHYGDNYIQEINGIPIQDGYALYTAWCSSKQLPILSLKKFNTYIRDRYKMFITYKTINNKQKRIYQYSDRCPACDRRFNKST